MVIQIGKTMSRMISYLMLVFIIVSYPFMLMLFPPLYAIMAAGLIFIFSLPSFLYIKKVMLNAT